MALTYVVSGFAVGLLVGLTGVGGGSLMTPLLTLLFGVYSIGPTERGVLTTFGRVQRTHGTTAEDPQLGALLTDEEKQRYNYPCIRVIPPAPTADVGAAPVPSKTLAPS